ncbi:MAG: AbiV family abortive infection protein [Thiobacillaceae bacterium]
MPTAPEDQQISQLARGAALALANAEDLFREASVLFACKAYSRALFLHQISMEECGKIEILGGWASGQLMGLPLNIKKVASALASHKAKNFANAYMLPVSEAERSAWRVANWQTAIDTFDEQQAEFHNQSNEKKNAALYVDFEEGIFRAPTERITEDMCHEIAARNSEFLELVRPKVSMLGRWAENQEGARSTLIEFQARMEELHGKYPSEPQKALDLVFEEMLAKAIEQRALK